MRKIGIGAEGSIHKSFAAMVRQYEAYGKLDCSFWTYSASGEHRSPITGALLKAKGLAKGFPDYVFFQKRQVISAFEAEYDLKVVFIEFKAGKGKQSDSQKEFQAKFDGLHNARYYLCYSVEEALKALQAEKIIKS